VKPTSINPNAVPSGAQGVVTSPVVADLSGNGTKQIALEASSRRCDDLPTLTARTAHTLRVRSAARAPAADTNETTPEGGCRAPPTRGPFYVARGLAEIHGLGQLDYLAGEVGNGILGVADRSGPPLFSIISSRPGTPAGRGGARLPRVIEDWQFFNGPAFAEISGDSLPVIIDSSGATSSHASTPAGVEPAGWPKLTGHGRPRRPPSATSLMTATSTLGRPPASARSSCGRRGGDLQPDQWRKFRHDEWNTAPRRRHRRPARIDDLRFSVSRTSAKYLDGTRGHGRCGTAQAYELRASATAITRALRERDADPIAPRRRGHGEARSFTPPAGALFLRPACRRRGRDKGPIASVGTLDLRRVRMKRPGGGHDRLTLKGRVLLTLAQLGSPGRTSPSRSRTAARVLQHHGAGLGAGAERHGTKVTFRGTIGAALVRLRLAAGCARSVALARDLNPGRRGGAVHERDRHRHARS